MSYSIFQAIWQQSLRDYSDVLTLPSEAYILDVFPSGLKKGLVFEHRWPAQATPCPASPKGHIYVTKHSAFVSARKMPFQF
jgi:hypothetical protein